MRHRVNYTYILECSDGSFYTGWTNDIRKRVASHSAGKGGKYTRAHLPVRLVYLEMHESRQEAMQREVQIKKLSRKQKEELIASSILTDTEPVSKMTETGSCSETERRMTMEYGLQMYSVRDLTEKDLFQAMKEVADTGYRYVEFAGFFGHTAEEVREELQKDGLTVSGIHAGIDDLLNRFDETVAYQKMIGNTEYIIPWADLFSKEKIDLFISQVNELQPKLQKEGIRLSYHNHDFEFKKTEDGLIPFEELVSRTGICLEIDTFWAYAAGRDPVALMEKYKDRLTFIHIKDGFENGDGKPLGQGTAPVQAVYEKAKELGVLMVVESETLTPDGMTEARECFDCLKKLEK